MGWFLASVLAVIVVTVIAARLVVVGWPKASAGSQITGAAISAPTVCVLLFGVAVVLTLIDGARLNEPGGSAGMAVFALVFFLLYGLVISLVAGLPTAIIAVRALRSR